MKTYLIEAWMLVDADGDYGIGKTRDEAHAHYRQHITDDEFPRRYVKVLVRVPEPGPVEVLAEASPDEDVELAIAAD